MNDLAHAAALDRGRGEPAWAWRVLSALGVLALAPAPAIAVYLAWRGSRALVSGREFLGLDWYPTEALFGLVPLVAGTLLSSLLGLCFALPLGLGCALYLSFYAGPRAARVVGGALGILGGMPSVVFGLLGTIWLLPRIGPSWLTASLVLGAMIAPTFALLAQAAFDAQPRSLVREGLALGVSRTSAIRGLVLPRARFALYAAMSLSLSRALGEALAVEMVCGNVAELPTSLGAPLRTLTTTLVQEFEYARGDHADALHLVALLVVALAALQSGIALRMAGRRA